MKKQLLFLTLFVGASLNAWPYYHDGESFHERHDQRRYTRHKEEERHARAMIRAER